MYVMQRFFESKDRVKYERRDAAHATPTPLPWEEFEQEHARSCAPCPKRRRKERQAEYLKYLREEWESEFLHHAYIVVLDKHSHEHCGSCGNEGKDDRGVWWPIIVTR